MIIKVCGMREPENIRAIEQSGADWMGFIFFPQSARYVSHRPEYLPEQCHRIGVFVNESSENIGARRLHTILETVLDDISFNASGEHPLVKVVVDENYVKEHLSDEFDGEDLEKFIL